MSELNTSVKLYFSPYAWAKLCYMRDLGDTEVAGFGICPNKPLWVEDFRLVGQEASAAAFEMTQEGLAEFYLEMDAAGLEMHQYSRVMIHTHPGDSVVPSGEDEKNFRENYGRAEWAVMVILGKRNSVSARLHFGVGPGGDLEIPWAITYSSSKGWDDEEKKLWDAEYRKCVRTRVYQSAGYQGGAGSMGFCGYWDHNSNGRTYDRFGYGYCHWDNGTDDYVFDPGRQIWVKREQAQPQGTQETPAAGTEGQGEESVGRSVAVDEVGACAAGDTFPEPGTTDLDSKWGPIVDGWLFDEDAGEWGRWRNGEWELADFEQEAALDKRYGELLEIETAAQWAQEAAEREQEREDRLGNIDWVDGHD